jgi:hypothetical protein
LKVIDAIIPLPLADAPELTNETLIRRIPNDWDILYPNLELAPTGKKDHCRTLSAFNNELLYFKPSSAR